MVSKTAAGEFVLRVMVVSVCMLVFSSCSSTYYGAMEKMGMHKRDIMVDRVEDARDAQTDAQQQFKSALEQFDSVVKLKETNLKKAYDSLNREYEKSRDAAERVSSRIDKVESVADALFDEWEDELGQYQNKELKQSSSEQLKNQGQVQGDACQHAPGRGEHGTGVENFQG